MLHTWNCKGPVSAPHLSAPFLEFLNAFLCEVKVTLEGIADSKVVQFCVPGAVTGAQALYLILSKWCLVVKHSATISSYGFVLRFSEGHVMVVLIGEWLLNQSL